MLPAVVLGRRRHRWDFSQGPFQAELLLKTCNRRRVAASLCCEAGTSLDLHTPDMDSTWLHSPRLANCCSPCLAHGRCFRLCLVEAQAQLGQHKRSEDHVALRSGSEARRWHMKPQAELPLQGASVPGTPSRGPSSSGGPESARTSPASTPRPTGTPLSGDLLPAGCASSSGYLWTGQTRASIPHLEPGATAEVPLQVALLAPSPSTPVRMLVFQCALWSVLIVKALAELASMIHWPESAPL